PCPRTTDQRRGTLTKQRKPAIIFDTANRSTTTAPAETRGGCKHSSPQCQRAAAAAVPQIPNRYEKSGLAILKTLTAGDPSRPLSLRSGKGSSCPFADLCGVGRRHRC